MKTHSLHAVWLIALLLGVLMACTQPSRNTSPTTSSGGTNSTDTDTGTDTSGNTDTTSSTTSGTGTTGGTGGTGTPSNDATFTQTLMHTLTFHDARTLEPITPTVKVNFAGSAAGRVQDENGVSQSSYTTDEALLIYRVQASTGNPLKVPAELIAIVEAEGYQRTSVPVTLDALEDTPADIPLINLSSPPEGVSSTSQRFQTDATGALTETLTISPPTDSLSGSTASITLPKGTVLTDADGRPVTGTIEAQVTYFSNQSEAALDAFPGGFVAREAGQEFLFITGGFAAFDMASSSGRRVKNFSQDITMSIGVPSATENPETGKAVAVGDRIPIWSYDTDTGEWQREVTAEVVQTESGGLTLTYQANHLSYWNVDWKGPFVCLVGITINIIGNPEKIPLYLDVSYPNGKKIRGGRGWWTNPITSDTLTFRKAPSNISVVLSASVYKRGKKIVVGSKLFPSLCFIKPGSTDSGTGGSDDGADSGGSDDGADSGGSDDGADSGGSDDGADSGTGGSDDGGSDDGSDGNGNPTDGGDGSTGGVQLSADLPVDLRSIPSQQKVNLDLDAGCYNFDTESFITPDEDKWPVNAPFWYKDTSSSRWRYGGWIRQGKLTLNLWDDLTYEGRIRVYGHLLSAPIDKFIGNTLKVGQGEPYTPCAN